MSIEVGGALPLHLFRGRCGLSRFGGAARPPNNWANTMHMAGPLANHRQVPTTNVLITPNTAAVVLLHISVVTSYMKETAAL